MAHSTHIIKYVSPVEMLHFVIFFCLSVTSHTFRSVTIGKYIFWEVPAVI